MYLRSHAQKYIPGVYLHVCKLYTCVNLAHANWTIDSKIPPYLNQKFQASSYLVVVQPDLCQILSETPNIMKTCPCNVTCNPLTPQFYMSLVMRKPAFCICENKDAEQLCGNREADQRLCFRYTDTTNYNPSST